MDEFHLDCSAAECTSPQREGLLCLGPYVHHVRSQTAWLNSSRHSNHWQRTLFKDKEVSSKGPTGRESNCKPKVLLEPMISHRYWASSRCVTAQDDFKCESEVKTQRHKIRRWSFKKLKCVFLVWPLNSHSYSTSATAQGTFINDGHTFSSHTHTLNNNK